jgi:branched-chain amino acid transport system ATP-binding protein
MRPSWEVGDQSLALGLQGIGVRFGGLVALDDVSLQVPAGGIVGVIGPNGAGKTTLFNVICGFVRPNSGTMARNGQEFRPKPSQLNKLGIARTLQGVGLFAGMTVLENVVAGATHTVRSGFTTALLGLPPSDREERRLKNEAMALLTEFQVDKYAGAYPAMLPYALRKRVALARALAAKPKLLLLDEPAGGLGQDDIEDLVKLVVGLPKRTDEGACAVLLVEHHMDFVMKVCDSIVVLDFGRVIATGTPQQVQDNPAVAEAYLGTEVVGTEVTDAVTGATA